MNACLEIFDTHHHFWCLREGHYPWLQEAYRDDFFLGAYRSLRRDFLPDDYRVAIRPYRVTGSVHIEAERARDEQLAETSFIASLQRESGLPSAIVGHAYFDQPDLDDVLAKQAACPAVRGIRSKPVVSADPHMSVRGQAGSMQHEQWLRGFSRLEQYGFSWDLRVPYWHLTEAAEVARTFARTPIVVNHLGLPLDRSPAGLSAWRDGLESLARHENVYIKVSELGLAGGGWDFDGNRDVVRTAIGIFGFERVMFGSNLPVSSLSASFDMIVQTILAAVPDASSEQLDRLFSLNGREFYRIPTSK